MRKSSPKLREVSGQKLSATLKHWGCLNYHSGAARGWTFPPLMEMRAQWEKRFGKREWNHSISEWGIVKKEGEHTEYF